jgi:hypothetical protein
MPTAGSDMRPRSSGKIYLFGFFDTGDRLREREVEQALIDHIQWFLLEEKTRIVLGACGEKSIVQSCVGRHGMPSKQIDEQM